MQAFRGGGGALPDDNDARSVTILDEMCRAIRKAVFDLETLERLDKQQESRARRGAGW